VVGATRWCVPPLVVDLGGGRYGDPRPKGDGDGRFLAGSLSGCLGAARDSGNDAGRRGTGIALEVLQLRCEVRGRPSAAVFEGHDGIRQMCETANQWSSDLEFRVLSRQTAGSMFSFETETSGINSSPLGGLPATGRRFVLRAISVGRVNDNGLVSEHRDYWDLGSFLTQIGRLPPMG
jgi:hypothetical protein